MRNFLFFWSFVFLEEQQQQRLVLVRFVSFLFFSFLKRLNFAKPIQRRAKVPEDFRDIFVKFVHETKDFVRHIAED